ncbi:hypothetical protein STENM327S_07934 [Streptomyces tendae]
MAEAADFQGTSASPARRWLRRTTALLAGAPLLAGLVQLPAAGAAHAEEATAALTESDSGSVAVAVDSLTPSAPTDGDTVTVSGTVTNRGKQAVTDAHVGLRVGPPVDTRSSVDAIAKDSDDLQGSISPEIDDKYTEKFSKLAPGVAEHFNISVPVDDLNLGNDGVYEFAVSLSGETSAQPWEQILGIQRTFLPWQPDEADTRTKTTALWPLVSTTHMAAETGPNEEQTPVFLNNDLAKEISPGGRLNQMVALGKDLDITWVVDPDLLASVDAMTGSYRVRDGDKTTAGTQQAVAKQWLADLQDAVADKEVVALPFADPDLASLAHNGTDVTGSLSQLKDATDVVDNTVEPILHVKPNTDFAWPVDGAVDRSIVKVATPGPRTGGPDAGTCRTATTLGPPSSWASTTWSARPVSSVTSRTPSRTSSATSSRAAATPRTTTRRPCPPRPRRRDRTAVRRGRGSRHDAGPGAVRRAPGARPVRERSGTRPVRRSRSGTGAVRERSGARTTRGARTRPVRDGTHARGGRGSAPGARARSHPGRAQEGRARGGPAEVERRDGGGHDGVAAHRVHPVGADRLGSGRRAARRHFPGRLPVAHDDLHPHRRRRPQLGLRSAARPRHEGRRGRGRGLRQPSPDPRHGCAGRADGDHGLRRAPADPAAVQPRRQ